MGVGLGPSVGPSSGNSDLGETAVPTPSLRNGLSEFPLEGPTDGPPSGPLSIRGQAVTTLRGTPAMKARTFSVTSCISRFRAAVLAQAKWGVM